MYQHSPVTNHAASLARYTMSCATSPAVPTRFIGVFLRLASMSSGGYWSVPLVRMMPGATALTWMLCCAHSTASVFVMFSTPARAAPVWTMPGKPRATLAMTFTIAPALRGDHVLRSRRPAS